jgi:phenylacetate-coenzyme A ligase PaaK-like adenylate-forming protein
MVGLHRHRDGSVSVLETRQRDLDRMSRFFALIHRVSRHYRTVMDRAGLSLNDSPVEVLGSFPPTSREDYRDILHPEALVRLGGDRFVCDYSSGSTGRCVLRLATPTDELGEQSVTERVFRQAGMRAGDTFVCADVGFPEIYEFYARAARALGVMRTTYLHLNRDFRRSLEPIGRLAPDVFLTLPSLLARCWPHLRSVWPLGRSPIRSLIFMGEPLHPKLRGEVAQTLGCRVYSFYGTTETGGMAGECDQGAGCHFDPTLIGATIARPQFVDEVTVQGELLLTTWHLRDHSIVKYDVGDVVRITRRPCACGEASPRLTVVERAHEGFVLAGLKLRYQTVFNALKEVAGNLDGLSITLSDLPESEGHTLMRLDIPERFRPLERELLEVVKYKICELDDLYQFGLVRFQLNFQDDGTPERRKLWRVSDRRRYVGEFAEEDAAGAGSNRTSGSP